jgi:acyl-CoA dehydrogenase
MNLDYSAAEIAFREDARRFIASHLPDSIRHAQAMTPSVFAEPEITGTWQRALHSRGWVASAWPKEYGGPGWTSTERLIFEQECARAGAPHLFPLGIQMVGPVIIGFGTEQQKAHYLPRILSGEDYWCQGYSEPGAGSDLASLKTRAVRDGDHYLINGSKIWTTHAHHANMMFALVRTGTAGQESARKQDGISFILIDMKSKGISIRPIRTIGGDHEVNQVFFDDVRVPMANRVGDEGKGWSYGKYLLEFERGAGVASPKLRSRLNAVIRLIDLEIQGYSSAPHEGLFAVRLAEIDADIDALEMMELRVMSEVAKGNNPGVMASLLKLRASELRQDLTRVAVEVLGSAALIWEPRRPLYEIPGEALLPETAMTVTAEHLNSRAQTIFGGTSEVQREIIAKVMLGL